MILVTGITGRIGSSLAKHLLELGHEVGGLVRDPKQINQLPAGVRGFVGDYTDPDSTREAFEASESLYLMCTIGDIEGLYEVAKGSRVRHVVQLSATTGASGDAGNPFVRTERVAESSGIPHTVLRPFMFMSNAFRWADQVRAGGPIRLLESLPTPMIDPYDIGRVAAKVLATPGDHVRKVYTLSGSELLRQSDCVRMVGEAIGRDLEFVALTDQEFIEETSKRFGRQIAEFHLRCYTDASYVDRVANKTVEQLTGELPRTFAVWAQENRSGFIS